MSPVIQYDVTNVPDVTPDGRQIRPAVADEPDPDAPPAAEPGSFAARVSTRRVNLVGLIREGLPPLQYLPASDGLLLRGKRHLVAAPAKTGKSLGFLVHWVDVALAGGRVVVLDRENGQDTYAGRLQDVIEARTLTKGEIETVEDRLSYYEFPQLRPDDAPQLIREFKEVDVVVFDSSRMFLSDFGFKESESDDYARFMAFAIDPLFRAGIATVILDNTGHEDRARARGSAAKGDLNEIMFSLSIADEFGPGRRGRLRLKVERSRFGSRGEWTMELGDGAYRSWVLADDDQPPRTDFRDTVLKVLSDGRPRGLDKLIAATRDAGIQIQTDNARRLLKQYADDPRVRIRHDRRGYFTPQEAR